MLRYFAWRLWTSGGPPGGIAARDLGAADLRLAGREPALHHLGERLLHLAYECILDIAHHVIAEQGYRPGLQFV